MLVANSQTLLPVHAEIMRHRDTETPEKSIELGAFGRRMTCDMLDVLTRRSSWFSCHHGVLVNQACLRQDTEHCALMGCSSMPGSVLCLGKCSH